MSGQGGAGVWVEGFAVATVPKVRAVCPLGGQGSPSSSLKVAPGIPNLEQGL